MFLENIPISVLGPPKFWRWLQENSGDSAILDCKLVQKGHFLAFVRPCSLAQFQLRTSERRRDKHTRYDLEIDSENMS